MAEQTSTPGRPTSIDWKALNDQVKRANAGEPKAIEWLREFLESNPQVWHHLGDLALAAEKAWIKLITNGDALASEAIRRQLSQVREDLIGQTPCAVEKLLGDQIVATLLEVKYLESLTADAGGGSVTRATLLLKRLESAQRRHVAAIKSLLQMRKLLREQNTIPGLRIFGAGQKTA